MKTEQEASAGTALFTLVYLVGFVFLSVEWSFWWTLLLSPVYFFVVYLLTRLALSVGSTPKKPGDRVFSTSLLTTQSNRMACKVIVREGEILVAAWGVPDIHIPMERLEAILFKDESVPDKAMAGFGIDYIDYIDGGTARLMFFHDGLFPVHNTRKAVETILSAYRNHFKGCDVPPLPYVDMTPNRVDSVVHRFNQG